MKIDVTKMSCGSCTMCCKLLVVDELEKKQGQWCPHCSVGHGCKIYDRRPSSCQVFDCVWLQTQAKGDKAWGIGLRPDKAHFMVTVAKRDPGIVLHVDPGRPDAWKSPLGTALINKAVSDGLMVFVVCGDKRKLIRSTNIALPEEDTQ